jgi:hypothetical protein
MYYNDDRYFKIFTDTVLEQLEVLVPRGMEVQVFFAAKYLLYKKLGRTTENQIPKAIPLLLPNLGKEGGNGTEAGFCI